MTELSSRSSSPGPPPTSPAEGAEELTSTETPPSEDPRPHFTPSRRAARIARAVGVVFALVAFFTVSQLVRGCSSSADTPQQGALIHAAGPTTSPGIPDGAVAVPPNQQPNGRSLTAVGPTASPAPGAVPTAQPDLDAFPSKAGESPALPGRSGSGPPAPAASVRVFWRFATAEYFQRHPEFSPRSIHLPVGRAGEPSVYSASLVKIHLENRGTAPWTLVADEFVLRTLGDPTSTSVPDARPIPGKIVTGQVAPRQVRDGWLLFIKPWTDETASQLVYRTDPSVQVQLSDRAAKRSAASSPSMPGEDSSGGVIAIDLGTPDPGSPSSGPRRAPRLP